MASVRVSVTGEPLGEHPISGEALMREVGLLAMRLIRTRTESMVDVHGAPFAPLSLAYAKAKAAAGLAPLPNLQVSGQMLNDMAITHVTPQSVTIAFVSSGGSAPRPGLKGKGRSKVLSAATFIQRSRSVGAADKAYYNSEPGAGRVTRDFFGLSDEDEDAIERAIDAYLDRQTA